jgi:hypothetical protein
MQVRFLYGVPIKFTSGCSVVWLTRLVWDQEIAGSNPVIPTAGGQGRFYAVVSGNGNGC